MRITKNASVLVIFLCLLTLTAKAQYKGGSGDGYDMAEVSNIALGEAEIPAENYAINIYPNPVSSNAEITIALGEFASIFTDLTICNIFGAAIYKTIINNNGNMRIGLEAKHFPAGIYMVKFIAADGRTIQRKLIVN